MRERRWRAALCDRRLVALLGITIALSLALLVTPVAGRAWLVFGWGILVYLAAVAAWAWKKPSEAAPKQPAPRRDIGDAETPQGPAFTRSTEEALRRLNNPAALGDCALAGQLPWTLKRVADRDGDLPHQGQHHALRTALVQAIDRLKPPEGAGSGEQGLYHAILYDEYVLGHPTARIMSRYAISESTFHRYRRDALRALAQDLATQEAALARAGR